MIRPRLVQKNHRGLPHRDPSELQETLLAAAQRPRELVSHLSQVESIEQLARTHTVAQLGRLEASPGEQGHPHGATAVLLGGQQHVVHHREAPPLSGRLKRPDQPARSDLVSGLSLYRFTPEDNGPGVGLEEAGDEVDHGALARSIRPDQTDHRTLRNREAGVHNGAHPPKAFWPRG